MFWPPQALYFTPQPSGISFLFNLHKMTDGFELSLICLCLIKFKLIFKIRKKLTLKMCMEKYLNKVI